jgi:hypothetical protein
VSDDGIETAADSVLRNSLNWDAGLRPGSESRPEPNVRSGVEFKVAWVYISYTLKTEENMDKH